MTTQKAIRLFEFMLHCIGRTNMTADNANTVAAFELAVAALKEQEERENQKQLTIEEMLNMDAPVWNSCNTFDGKNGYWCICQQGTIICPSGICFDVRDIPNWIFYRYEPKGE